MDRFHQVLLIGSTLVGSWLGMQAVHEFGHVVGAWLTGGKVERVVLHPLSISRTDVAENPHPLAVAWAGPIGGVILPLVLWFAAAAFHSSAERSPSGHIRSIRPIGVLLPPFVLRFFAGFCLICNGLYIGLGSFSGIGDCGDLLRHGASIWQLWLFGALAAPAGLVLWHGQGRWFGFGSERSQVSAKAAYGSFAVCLALLVLCVAVAACSA